MKFNYCPFSAYEFGCCYYGKSFFASLSAQAGLCTACGQEFHNRKEDLLSKHPPG